MDEMRDKMKDLMKKVNKPFSSSSSGKFKGQGRVLGSSSSQPQRISTPPQHKSEEEKKPETRLPPPPAPTGNNPSSETGFDPFNSLITSGKRNPNGYSLQVFECPVCGRGFTSEEEVSSHVDSCLGTSSEPALNSDQLRGYVNAYLSGKPSDASLEVMIKLVRNILKDPSNPKFRKVRTGNIKIKEAIIDVAGGVEFLEFIGFKVKEEDAEMWLVMEEEPTEKVLSSVTDAVSLLESHKVEEEEEEQKVSHTSVAKLEDPIKPKQIDRQIRVFFSVPESVAAKIEVPDSFYNLGGDELKREAEMRRKKLEDSKLLIPKSYREKKQAKKRYRKTVIRVQFPDGVVLQAIFSPSETTDALYQFVSSALKDPGLEFDLLHPVLVRRRVIPRAGEKPAVTLEDEDLVPAALVKLKPIETDDVVFTGLTNDLLLISEPL
ncbi:hypothetical protein M569_10169, partial [Genlisea aurea]